MALQRVLVPRLSNVYQFVTNPLPQTFAWQAVASGNDTASPSANLDLLFGKSSAAPPHPAKMTG
jgi:hypothetical protein